MPGSAHRFCPFPPQQNSWVRFKSMQPWNARFWPRSCGLASPRDGVFSHTSSPPGLGEPRTDPKNLFSPCSPVQSRFHAIGHGNHASENPPTDSAEEPVLLPRAGQFAHRQVVSREAFAGFMPSSRRPRRNPDLSCLWEVRRGGDAVRALSLFPQMETCLCQLGESIAEHF